MGWSIKIKKDKYRIWSSVVDDYITESLTKDELINFLFWSKFERLMDDMLKEIMCFPNGWINEENGEYLNYDSKSNDEYYKILNNRKEKYNKFFDEIKRVGISIDLKDNNVHIYNK